ncbi:MAG: hypothetical protein M3R69_08905, partial [Acidobacteriota bacterium]|nr:hypothetical protein [Acidobacteriota bacterium]
WKADATSKGIKLKLLLSTPATLLDDLFKFDSHHGRLRFWFDTAILSDEWFTNHLVDVRSSAYPRYTPELTIQTALGEAFEGLGQTDAWYGSLRPRVREFRELIEDWERCVGSKKDDVYEAEFPARLRRDGKKLIATVRVIYDNYERLAEPSRNKTVNVSKLKIAVEASTKLAREIRAGLAAELDTKHGKGRWESKGFRQFMAEYQLTFPAANVDKADEIIKVLENFDQWLGSPSAQLTSATGLLVLGGAGVGKTHGICDNADRRATDGLRTIVLFGERFSGSVDPWEAIRQQLGFDGTVGRDEMLAAFDTAAEATGKPLLFAMDGLNETKPRTYWATHLPALIEQFKRYDSLRLCVSCRSTYENQVVPRKIQLPVVEHKGFAGIEFDACKEFFGHYGLEPPVAPILQPEFSNPLFLRLICEAMVDAGITQLPLGWHGISTAIDAFIGAKNGRYAGEYDSHPNHRYPQRALLAIVTALERTKASSLPWSDADEAVTTILPKSQGGSSLLDWLVREGLLIADAGPNLTADTPQDHVRLAFERLGDHLLANQLLAKIETKEIASAFEDGGTLEFLVANTQTIGANRGVLEALSIQIPERYALELPNLMWHSPLRTDLVKIAIEALPWRDCEYISSETTQLLRESQSLKGYWASTFDIALTVSTRSSPVDAMWFHNLLNQRVMADRDGYWCHYLHLKYEENGPVKKLLRAALEVDPIHIQIDIAERWATILIWFCAAADRRVRDNATKALVRITEPCPQVWATLIERFIGCDDEYIVERCLLAAYGTLLRTRIPVMEGAIAGIVFREVFTDSDRFQNALIRDHARSIIELAKQDQALPQGIDESAYLPPYKSEWPLQIPSAEDVENYNNSHEQMPKLYRSVMDDDFFVYTLGVLDPYLETFDKRSMARWIFQHVLDMGYPGKQLANYDGYMLYQYGGGRGRPTWAERIGKKYQWIALARLIARLADHVKPKSDTWDPDPLTTPLVYERGRDIDPSLIIQKSYLERKQDAWWIREHYDFEKAASLTHEDWVKVHKDIPDTGSILSGITDTRGDQWIILESHPEWNSRTPEMSQFEAYRLVWVQIRSYLIPMAESKKLWEWAPKQNFFGRWMPEGARLHDGFVGEYPFATTMNLYEDRYLSRGGIGSQEPPCDVYPTSNSIGAHYEEDSYQDSSINLLVPARKFFAEDSLRWNGVGGYSTSDGVLRFIDPSVEESGPSTLLVEAHFLRQFLAKHKLVLFWTVLGEKLRIIEESWPRLVYSRAHMLTSGKMVSSELVITDK